MKGCDTTHHELQVSQQTSLSLNFVICELILVNVLVSLLQL